MNTSKMMLVIVAFVMTMSFAAAQSTPYVAIVRQDGSGHARIDRVSLVDGDIDAVSGLDFQYPAPLVQVFDIIPSLHLLAFVMLTIDHLLLFFPP
jgi:hypothetical protein